jgi:hypothetical protein
LEEGILEAGVVVMVAEKGEEAVGERRHEDLGVEVQVLVEGSLVEWTTLEPPSVVAVVRGSRREGWEMNAMMINMITKNLV